MDLTCQADGCGHDASRLAPDARGREQSLASLVRAPIACFCPFHADRLSDLYARAAAWALCDQYSRGATVALGHVQALCDQLQEMPTHTAQATYAILGQLEGIH